jgi:chromate transport protein ChrA
MSFLDTFPVMLGQALGVPGPVGNQQYAGGLLLSMAILAMVGLALSATLGKSRNERSNLMVTSIVIFVTMGFLYVITWLPFTFLVVAMVIVAILFGGEIKKMARG